MWLKARGYILMALFVIPRLNAAPEKSHNESGRISQLEKGAGELIEKILNVVEDFRAELRNKYKCIPDETSDAVVKILQNAIDCVDGMEKQKWTKNVHKKLFCECFEHGEKKVRDLMNIIDPDLDHCPDVAETYEINVTSSVVKTFKVNFKNGLEIAWKTVGNGEVYDEREEYPAESATEESDDVEYFEYDEEEEEEEEEYDDENTTDSDEDSSKAVDLYDGEQDDTESSHADESKIQRRQKSKDNGPLKINP